MNHIDIIGLGAGDIDQLSLGIYRQLIEAKTPLFVRTEDHPVVETLKREQIDYQSFDSLYQEYDQFDEVYHAIVAELILQAKKQGKISYAVPGHPMLAEQTVQLLLDQDQVAVKIVGGQSYLDDMFSALKIDPIDGFQFLDATQFERDQIDYTNHLIFCQVYDQMIASDVKLQLLEDLPPEHLVTVVEAAGSSAEKIETVPLVELDRAVQLSNLTSVYVKPSEKELLSHQFQRLRAVIATLRGPDGCPWDQKQTHESLSAYLIEEAYELIDAIQSEDDDQIIEELGDVLLQVMLHSQIGEDQGYFTIDDVIRILVEKMIRRHPHVFGDTVVGDEHDVKENWEAIKKEERETTNDSSRLDRIPTSSTTLVMADQLQKEAAKAGFDWEDPEAVKQKLSEELTELNEAVASSNITEIEDELGDLFFSLVNLARHYKVSSDLALRKSNNKFTKRFKYMEEQLSKQGLTLANQSLEELDQLWEAAKQQERSDSK